MNNDRVLNDLIGSRICHDLISPLGAIGNGVELLSMTGTGAAPEMALISETLHAASAVATEHSEVLKISRPLFRRMLSEYPQLALLLQERISQSVLEFTDRLDIIRAKLDHATDLVNRPRRQTT